MGSFVWLGLGATNQVSMNSLVNFRK